MRTRRSRAIRAVLCEGKAVVSAHVATVAGDSRPLHDAHCSCVLLPLRLPPEALTQLVSLPLGMLALLEE